MKLILYSCAAEKNRLNKNRFLTKILDIDGTLRESCSILTPTITINSDDRNIFNSNYAYIPDFKRYYFITNITSIKKELWQISMRVDVLMSYYAEIFSTNAFITRNQYNYDLTIKDDLVSFYYDKEIKEEDVLLGSFVNTTFNTEIDNMNFMLVCTSFNAFLSAGQVDPPQYTNLPTIKSFNFNDIYSSTLYVLSLNEANITTYNALKHSDTVGSYIKSLIAYPFKLDIFNSDTSKWPLFYIGDTQIKTLDDQDIHVPFSKYSFSKYLIIADFTIDSPKTFLDHEPYTVYELYIPYCGWITLDSNKVLGKRIIVYYNVNFNDGSANAYIYRLFDNQMLWTGACQLGIKIGITSTNNEQLISQKNANNLNMTLGLTSAALSVGMGATSGNAVAVVGGIMAGAKSYATYVNNNSMMFDKAQATFTSGSSGMYASQKVRLRTTRYKTRGYDDDFTALFGRPFNKYAKIGNQTGYTQIGEVHLENFNTATDSELTEIETQLKNGIII